MKFLINCRPAQTRIAQMDGDKLVGLTIKNSHRTSLVGSIFQAKVSKVSTKMHTCFVDIGLSRDAYLNLKDFKKNSKDKDSENLPSLKTNQMLCVQVTKDPAGSKSARVSPAISLVGRRLVYLPQSDGIGISKKIQEEEERKRLLTEAESLDIEGGIIVRTVSEGKAEFQSDFDQLSALWKNIQDNPRKTPGLIYKDLSLELQILRDELNSAHKEIIVDDPVIYEEVKKFVQTFIPDWKKKISYYKKQPPLFEKYGIEKKWPNLLKKKVSLSSGGSIVIDETEALVSIDVNTGRISSKVKDGIFKTNMEAAVEIAAQIKLRNCSGIIVIDFIDMETEDSRNQILNAFNEELKKDRIYTEVISFSSLNLLQMTRKRMRVSLQKMASQKCSYCQGKGTVLTHHFVAYNIFREIESFYLDSREPPQLVEVHCHPDTMSWIYENEMESLEWFKTKHNMELSFKENLCYHVEKFELKSPEKLT